MTFSSFTRCIAFILLGMVAVGRAQQPEIGVPVPPLGAGPFVFDTAEQHKIRVTVVTKGLSHPWAIAFLPDGNMLVTERPGRIRVVRNGVLDPTPIAGVPRVRTDGNGGLMDVALHPQFADKPTGLLHLHQARRERQRHAVPRARPARRRSSHRRQGPPGAGGLRRQLGSERPRRLRTGWHGLHVDRRQYRQDRARALESSGQDPAPARRWLRTA